MKIDFDETLFTDLINIYNLVQKNQEKLSLSYSQLQSMDHLSQFITRYAMQEQQDLGKTYPNWNGVVILQITKKDFNLTHLLQEIHYARLNHIVILCPHTLHLEVLDALTPLDNLKVFTYDPEDPRYDIMKMIYRHFGHLHSVTIPIF